MRPGPHRHGQDDSRLSLLRTIEILTHKVRELKPQDFQNPQDAALRWAACRLGLRPWQRLHLWPLTSGTRGVAHARHPTGAGGIVG